MFNRLAEYKKLSMYFGLERVFKSLKKQTNIPIPKKLTGLSILTLEIICLLMNCSYSFLIVLFSISVR